MKSSIKKWQKSFKRIIEPRKLNIFEKFINKSFEKSKMTANFMKY